MGPENCHLTTDDCAFLGVRRIRLGSLLLGLTYRSLFWMVYNIIRLNVMRSNPPVFVTFGVDRHLLPTHIFLIEEEMYKARVGNP